MQTFRQLCSDILHDLRSFNLDDRLSFRFIKNKFIDKISIFVKQDSEMRKLQKLSNLWSKIECFKLEEVPVDSCDSEGCSTILKSVDRVPAAYETSYGYALQVFNNSFSKQYIVTTPGLYKDLMNRRFKSNNGYYWIVDGYLYFPDSLIDSVTLMIMGKDGKNIEAGVCSKPLDNVVNFPDYLIAVAKSEVLKELAGIEKKIMPDDKPNDNRTNR